MNRILLIGLAACSAIGAWIGCTILWSPLGSGDQRATCPGDERLANPQHVSGASSVSVQATDPPLPRNEAASQAAATDRQMIDPSSALVPLNQLRDSEHHVFVRLGQVLKESGRTPLPESGAIVKSDLDYVVAAFLDMDSRLVTAYDDMMKLANSHSDAAVDEIQQHIAAGQLVPYEVLQPGQDPKRYPEEVVTVCMPARSGLRYIIRIPHSLIGEHMDRWRAIAEGELEFADREVRRLIQ